MRENTDQKNPEYGHFLHSAYVGHRQRPKMECFFEINDLMQFCGRNC